MSFMLNEVLFAPRFDPTPTKRDGKIIKTIAVEEQSLMLEQSYAASIVIIYSFSYASKYIIIIRSPNPPFFFFLSKPLLRQPRVGSFVANCYQ